MSTPIQRLSHHELPIIITMDDVVYRMELYGYNMGLRIGELLSQDGDKFVEPLEIMKFICRDVWKVLWQTNG